MVKWPRGYKDRIGPWMAKREILAGMGIDPKDVVVLDIGAHQGDVAAMYLRMWPDAEYHLFEPIPESCKSLEDRFRGKPNVHVIDCAVGHRTEDTRVFHVGGHTTEMSSLATRPLEGHRYYRHDKFETIHVPVVSLDDYVKASCRSVHLVKADIQGGEYEMLEGAKYVLRYKRPPLLYMEVFFVPMYEGSKMLWEICQFLDRYGYSLFDLYDLGRARINRQLKYADAMFVSKEARERVLDKYPEEWLPKSLAFAMGMRRWTGNPE